MAGHEVTHDAALAENPFFFYDTHGDRPNHDAPVINNAPVNTGVLSELDSSEDEVIFSGRQTTRNDVAFSRVRAQVEAPPVVVNVVEDDIQFLSPANTDKALESEWNGTIQDSFINLTTKEPKKNQRLRNRNKRSTRNDEDAIIADYVRNVNRQDDSSSGDEAPEDDELGLSSKDKAKFRALSTLETIEISGQASNDVSDEASDSDSDDSDDSSSLEELLSHIRRGASFTKLEDSWASPDVSMDILDIIDNQRDGPLKKKKKKGRRQMDFGLSDSDLELQLETTFEKDRDKKRAKKKEREQLRAQGLLGKKNKKSDRRFKDGFSIESLKDELKRFLQSDSESLDLPPMEKYQRRLVHEISNSLGLKSNSRGHGNARFPVLYKTGRTPNFNGKHSVKLDKIFAQPRFHQRQNGRMKPSVREHVREQQPKNNRQRPNMAAGYLEGEVVGASAPEIGANNKGRAMLEKMGWSTGTALGALNNKGILQPVSQVVKNTRAGLG